LFVVFLHRLFPVWGRLPLENERAALLAITILSFCGFSFRQGDGFPAAFCAIK
jgi:hypothetical protein